MAVFLRKYGTGTGADIWIPVIKRAVVDGAVGADWTPASGDVKVSIDGAAVANIGTLPVALAAGNTAWWKFVFADSELQGKRIMVSVSDSATKAVEDQYFIVETYGNASAMYQADLSAANLPANLVQIGGSTQSGTDLKDFADDGYDPSTNKVQGVVLVDTLTTYTGNTPQAGDAYAIVSSGTHGNAALKTLIDAVDNFVDTEVADLQSRLPAALTADGNMKSDALRFGGTLYATALAAEVDAVWDEDATAHQTQGTFGQAIGDPAADSDSIWALVNAIGATGTGLSAIPWNAAWDAEVQSEATDALNAYDPPTNAEMEARTLAAASYATASALDAVDNFVDTEVASLVTSVAALWTTALTESYRTDGSTGTPAQLLYEILSHHAEVAISNVTKTTKKIDGSTTATTLTLNDATTPTAITRAT